MTRYLIEHGRFVAPLEFDTQEQFDRFQKLGTQECDKKNREMEELAEHRNIPDDCYPRCYFGYRESFDRTDNEEEWDKLDRLGETPFSVNVTTVYPESVIKNAPSSFIDKRANWENRTANSSDVNAMERLLRRAEQVRKDLPKIQSDKFSDSNKRKQFIYECAQDITLSWRDVAEKVEKEFGIISTTDATEQAARDHVKKYKLTPLPTRPSGRKPGSTPKQHDE